MIPGTSPWLLFRRASKREKIDTPGRKNFGLGVLPAAKPYGGRVLAEDGRTIQAWLIWLDADAPAARTEQAAPHSDDQRILWGQA